MKSIDHVRGARAVTAALLALGVLLGVLVVLRLLDARPADHRSAAAPTACSGVRYVECREIDTAGGRVRYAFLGGDPGTRDVALFDVGGPGASVFGEQWPSGYGSYIEPRMAGERSLVLEEPWVTAELSEECRGSLSAWFVDAHAGRTPRTDLVEPCSLGTGTWGWTSASFREAVEAVEAVEGVRVRGLVAASFGAHRALYVGQSLEWAVLANPAPRTMAGNAYLAERERGVLAMLQAQCDCGDAFPERLEAVVSGVTGSQPGTRSLPLTRADVGAAALALTYQAHTPGTGYVEKFWAGDPEAIGVLADSVWARYGTTSISTSYLAYLDEVCAAYAPWPRSTADDGIVSGVLSALHSPCVRFPGEQDAVTTLPPSVRTCVSSQSQDPIAPEPFVRTWLPADHRITQEGSSHSNVDGVTACLETLRGTPGDGPAARATRRP